jgi:hypothetical protein
MGRSARRATRQRATSNEEARALSLSLERGLVEQSVARAGRREREELFSAREDALLRRSLLDEERAVSDITYTQTSYPIGSG